MNKLYTLKKLTGTLFVLLFQQALAQVPVAKFGPNKILYCEQYGSVQLFDSSTNNPTQWEWNVYDSTTYKNKGYYLSLQTGEVYADPWGNGNNEFSKNPEFAFDIPGTYTVSMRCKNSSGWSNWIIKKVCIKVQLPTLYNLGYGTYGANNDNIVDSDTGNIFDDGGENLNYGNNQGLLTRSFLLIKPCKAKTITLKMHQLKFADNNDVLSVYDGDAINQNKLLASWTKNNTTNRTVVANSGSMLIIFNSNSSGVDSGFHGTYSVLHDTTISSASYNFDIDSPYYNSKPARFYAKVNNQQGTPTFEWTVDGSQVSNNSKKNFNYTFYTDGKYKICVYASACDETQKICKDINVVTPTTKTTINFKYKSFARYAYDSVFLIPEVSNANRFEWSITPTTYKLVNPPFQPSTYTPGLIKVNSNPGDTLYTPRITFLDTVCYTIKLKAYNSLDPNATIDSLTKTNYICASDFRSIYGVFGNIYNDLNNNCQISSSEPFINDIPVKLYDNNNKLIATYLTEGRGLYRFPYTVGTYTIKLDLKGKYIETKCPTGEDSTVSISNQNQMGGVNFAIVCSQKKDIGVSSVNTSGWIFPGRTHQLNIIAGDLTNTLKSMNCNYGNAQSGIVTIELIGKASITGIPIGSATPNSNSGKMCTYNISNYRSLDLYDAFKLNIKVDTNANLNDSLTIKVKLTNSGTDDDTTNNKMTFKYRVRNSYDPNEKEVYPFDVPPLYNDWLTYTIHFQNTGSAPAFNIRLADTLDTNLDLETFTVLNASHDKRVSLKGRALIIYFDDIMLPDSFTDKEGSKGFFQYKIKPISGLTKGNKIKNTAYIYFDYNAPVVTNTTVNEYVEKNNSITVVNNSQNKIYPNPSNEVVNVECNETNYSIEIITINGQTVLKKDNLNGYSNINLQTLNNGIYIMKISSKNGVQNIKLIKN